MKTTAANLPPNIRQSPMRCGAYCQLCRGIRHAQSAVAAVELSGSETIIRSRLFALPAATAAMAALIGDSK